MSSVRAQHVISKENSGTLQQAQIPCLNAQNTRGPALTLLSFVVASQCEAAPVTELLAEVE